MERIGRVLTMLVKRWEEEVGITLAATTAISPNELIDFSITEIHTDRVTHRIGHTQVQIPGKNSPVSDLWVKGIHKHTSELKPTNPHTACTHASESSPGVPQLVSVCFSTSHSL